MGVSGLLTLLRSVQKPTTLKHFSGQTIGVDAFGWLHRGTVACAIELALGKPTTKHVDFAVSRVRMLLDFGITPYLVFDGDAVPSKSGTNQERKKRREEAKKLGLSLWNSGNRQDAYKEFQKAASITPQMTRQFIEALKLMNVAYLVAPYEADAQLVYLEKKGIIDGILSEDSDLLVFGAERLITKLDQYGECVEIERKDLTLCKEVSFAGWTDAMFRSMAILSGCDYLPNVSKMGLKTAHEYMRKYKDPQKAIRVMALNGKYCVPVDYAEQFKKAELAFLHHRVFCPIRREMVFLNELDPGTKAEDMPFLGPHVEPLVAVDVARGYLDPKTKERLTNPSVKIGPASRENRGSLVNEATELKPSKSIDSFFKLQRQPLAELDPNTLTPSPSQQRLLERNRNASWEPHTVRSAPQLRSLSGAVTTERSDGTRILDRNAFLARAGTMSTYKPPKRQRLCSDLQDSSSSQEFKQSPFFSSKSHDMSPLMQKTSRKRKSKKSDFEVWSDDSVEQILLGLGDEELPQDHKNQSTNQDNDTQQLPTAETEDQAAEIECIPQSSPAKADGVAAEETQSSHGTKELNNLSFQSAVDVDAAESNRINNTDDREEFATLLEHHVKRQNEDLMKKQFARTFTTRSQQEQEAALRSLKSPAAAAASEAESTSRFPVASVVQSATPSTSSQQATKSTSLVHTFVNQSPERQSFALNALRRTGIRREKTEPSPRSSNTKGTSTVPTSRSQTSLTEAKGSEDSLVPNSEDEVSETEDGGLRPILDLKRFAYVG